MYIVGMKAICTFQISAGGGPLRRGLRFACLLASAWRMNAGAVQPLSWGSLELAGPEAKILGSPAEADEVWFSGAGGGYSFFDGSSGLDDAPVAEMWLGRRFGDTGRSAARLSLSYLESGFSRDGQMLLAGESPPPSEPPGTTDPELPPVELPASGLKRVAVRDTLSGRIWYLDLSAEHSVLRSDFKRFSAEIVVRAGVGVAYHDFEHDDSFGPTARGGVLLRLSPAGPFSLEMGVDGRYTDSGLDGVGSYASAMVYAGAVFTF